MQPPGLSPSYSGAVQLVSRAAPHSVALSNSFLLACFFSLLGCSAVVYKSAIVSAPSAGEGSCPQHEQEMLSDSSPALIGCLIWAQWILANGLRGSRPSKQLNLFRLINSPKLDILSFKPTEVIITLLQGMQAVKNWPPRDGPLNLKWFFQNFREFY